MKHTIDIHDREIYDMKDASRLHNQDYLSELHENQSFFQCTSDDSESRSVVIMNNA